MKDKKRWEDWYEKFKEPSIQDKYKKLEEKVINKTISKDEYAEYQKMQKIANNIPKVDNLIEFMEKLESEFEAYKEEYKTRTDKGNSKSLEDLEKDMNYNMQKQDELIAKRKEINKKIATITDKEEVLRLQNEKEDINQELSKLRFQADKNNIEFARIKSEENEPKQINTKFYRYSDEELRTKCFKISSMISKCNMVATNLMKGLSVDSIQVKLENWEDKKFTAKTPLPLSRAEKLKAKAEKSQANAIPGNIKASNKATPISGLPTQIDEFEEKFPRLAKRFPKLKDNFLGKTLLKVKNFFRSEQELEEENKTRKLPNIKSSTLQQNPDKKTKKQNELFRDYLKYDVLEVAEKGVEQVRAERIERKKEEVKESKLKEENNEQTR